MKTTLLPCPKGSKVNRKIGNVVFPFDFSKGPSIYQMYRSAYEIATVEAMKCFLSKPIDSEKKKIFLDIGANLGYLTAVGLNLIGTHGEVHSFEPVPQYFASVQEIQNLNPGFQIYPNNFALGDKQTTAKITLSNYLVGYNTLIPDMIAKDKVGQEIDISIRRIDEYLLEKGIHEIALIKIDTEGYEYPVLRGMEKWFQANENRPPMIVEYAPQAVSLLKFALKDFVDMLKQWGYNSYDILTHKLVELASITKTSDIILATKAPQY